MKDFNALIKAAIVLISLALNCVAAADGTTTITHNGRDLLLYVPAQLPAKGSRAAVIVLHGGLGNAHVILSGRAESGMNLNDSAEHNGFIVAYLSGTPVTRNLGPNRLGWNAGGGCCGVPAARDIDDVAYIKGAVDWLVEKYGVDRNRVFGLGHSNGAMMTQRLVCEIGLYQAAVAISGPLNIDGEKCPGAKGKRILAIHGADDENVPVAGGRGTKGLSQVSYKSQERSRKLLTAAGAVYNLEIVAGADHKLGDIEEAIQKKEKQNLPEKITKFFGLTAKVAK